MQDREKLSRRAFTRSMVALPFATWLAACADSDPSRISIPNVPVPPLPSLEPSPEPPFDYCSIEQGRRKDEFATAKNLGTPYPTEIITQPNPEVLQTWSTSLENFVEYKGTVGKYQVVLMPVNYSEAVIQERMEHIMKFLRIIYKDVDIEFSYINKNVPVGIQHQDRQAFLINDNEDDIVLDKINKTHKVDTAMYIFNSKEWMGSGGYPVVMAGNAGESASYMAPHELAHHFLLTDSYLQYLPPEFLVNNTEIFTSTESLRAEVKPAFERVNPTPYRENAVCGNDPVYSFYSDPNLMGEGIFSEAEVLRRHNAGKSILNPMQIAIMNDFINRALATPQ